MYDAHAFKEELHILIIYALRDYSSNQIFISIYTNLIFIENSYKMFLMYFTVFTGLDGIGK